MTQHRMTEVANPVPTADGGVNCRNCHRPVTARNARLAPHLAVYVHAATGDRVCSR